MRCWGVRDGVVVGVRREWTSVAWKGVERSTGSKME
jgi:hypothetical protein